MITVRKRNERNESDILPNNEDKTISGQDRRLQKILFLLKRQGRVSVNKFSEILGVSQVTIRADLTELEQQKLVVRSYGAASLAPDSVTDRTMPTESNCNPDSVAIAKKALELIEEGDVVFFDGSIGSTFIVEALQNRESITVITSSLETALALSGCRGVAVYTLGGRVSPEGMTIPETISPDGFPGFNISKAFVGAWGATEADGFTAGRTEEAAFKKAIFSRSARRYVLLRSARWGKRSLVTFAALDSVDCVITDAGATDAISEYFSSRNIGIIKAAGSTPSFSAYSFFDSCCSAAEYGFPFEHSPGRGKRLAFANGCRSEPFCARVESGLLRYAALAGFSESDILVLDNDYNPELAVENAGRIVEWGADVVIEFNTDVWSNNAIAEIFRKANIPAVALEGVLPSAPFVGTNNWRAGSLAGDYAGELVAEKFGSWSDVAGVILVEMESAGELVLLRTEAFASSLAATFGDEAEERMVRIMGGNQYETAKEAVVRVASTLVRGGNYILTAVNAESLQGAVDALKDAGVWARERFISISHGDGENTRMQLAGGIVDASVIYYAEKYGAAAVPAACAIMTGAAVPPYVYIDQMLVPAGLD